jgi:alkylhydroperoxidase/carboxymuconolactone decarboxylase family protein YurZ
LVDTWQQQEMAFLDRILATLGILAAVGKVDEMNNLMRGGVNEAGITLDVLRRLVLQGIFYAGWLAGLVACTETLELFEAESR